MSNWAWKDTEASKGGMKVGRIKDPLYRDYYLGTSYLPSSHLFRRPQDTVIAGLFGEASPEQERGPDPFHLQGQRSATDMDKSHIPVNHVTLNPNP